MDRAFQWLSGSATAEEVRVESAIQGLLVRVAKLQKDAREWPRVLAEFLDLVPEGHRFCCKDRRVLEVALSLCDAELNPQGSADAGRVILLLRATQRLLGARGLYSLLPKYSLRCFMRCFMPQPRAAAPPIYAQPAVLAALQQFESACRLGGASAHCLGLLGLTLQAAGCRHSLQRSAPAAQTPAPQRQHTALPRRCSVSSSGWSSPPPSLPMTSVSSAATRPTSKPAEASTPS